MPAEQATKHADHDRKDVDLVGFCASVLCTLLAPSQSKNAVGAAERVGEGPSPQMRPKGTPAAMRAGATLGCAMSFLVAVGRVGLGCDGHKV
eukprot:365824-Chlamydomonas_euryale.AAC.9